MVTRILEISPGGDRELEMRVLLASTAGWPDREGILALTPDASERFHRAELLTRLGREQEALDWYANLVATSLYEIAYLGMAHLRQAQIHDRLGDREPALRHYRRFLELWRECDPELRPLVEEAEARFASLSG